jgi:hypothetical protein
VRQMMIALAGLAVTAPAAYAGPGADLAATADELRARAQSRAEIAALHPAAPVAPLDYEDPLLADLETFAAAAMRLSRTIEETDGPGDLSCIFRGMSEDAEARLAAIDDSTTGSTRSRVYIEIAELMRDAAEIAPDADE